MEQKTKKSPYQIKVGDFVFAKVPGFCAWPARILQDEGKMYRVYFYGSNNICKVTKSQIFEYEKWKDRFGNVEKNTFNIFKDAMKHVEYSIAHPGNDDSYFQALATLGIPNLANLPDKNSPAAPLSPSSSFASPEWGMRKKKKTAPFIHITGDSD
ncbi:GH17401 [Drosophila grimshawi]|uniref:GH17401 n=2 Tax=Drosophila grimshawi TaxID=7222 RepID=B4JV47_DROGR|nr:GH17401 [Drosophila grimshawi]